MSTAYIPTIAVWVLIAAAFFGTGSVVVMRAFVPPVEDEEAGR